MKCMLCGRENPDDALYCGGCGWPQKTQKQRGGWRIALLGILAVLLIAAAVFIFFRPAADEPRNLPAETSAPTEAASADALAAPKTYYERVAEVFVETYWDNDMPTLESLMEYHLFNYLEEELDTGRQVPCTAEAVQSAPCDADRIMGLQMTLGATISEAYAVRVNYETEVKSGNIEVTVGMVDGNWVVISYVPFYAD